jgi:hypothetical protein
MKRGFVYGFSLFVASDRHYRLISLTEQDACPQGRGQKPPAWVSFYCIQTVTARGGAQSWPTVTPRVQSLENARLLGLYWILP